MRRLATPRRPSAFADGVIAAAAREGLREYYDPRPGKGLGAGDFALVGIGRRVGGDPRP
ncbi:MAG: hypothetical protein U0R26_03075 [Solirubrobacterales bacterium]